MPQHITVTDYDPAWPRLFEREAFVRALEQRALLQFP